MPTFRPAARLAALLLAAAALSTSACTPRPAEHETAATDVRTVGHPDWVRDAVIYEVNVRQYTPEGTFAAFRRELPRLKALGVDVLWVMPIQPIGTAERKGGLGSYYAIRDYTAVNPEHGTAEDFRALVADAHAQGFRVILDWVANHTAFDHTWITAHPDFYVYRPDGTISVARNERDEETDWTDVAELDYGNPAMRREMLAAMRWWVDSMDVDGFRCDVAGAVPADFWATVRDSLGAARPGLFLLAEAEEPTLHTAFDATYGWELHHLLNRIAQGKAPADSLGAYLAHQRQRFPVGAMRMYFTSNHDENSWNGSEFERMGANHQAAFVVAATFEGSFPLLYSGQEASLSKRLRFFDKDTIDWSGPSLADFYRTVFTAKAEVPALFNADWGGRQTMLAHDGGPRVAVYSRDADGSHALVAVNFGDAPVTVRYRGLPAPGEYRDVFSGASSSLAAEGTLDVPAHGWRLLAWRFPAR